MGSFQRANSVFGTKFEYEYEYYLIYRSGSVVVGSIFVGSQLLDPLSLDLVPLSLDPNPFSFDMGPLLLFRDPLSFDPDLLSLDPDL